MRSEASRITVTQGEAYASAKPGVVMSTVLGSCIATCLYDPEAKVGGMNHFLLAEPMSKDAQDARDRSYGLFLMELLINEMLKLGAQKSRMKARVYGGANMSQGLGRIGSVNAAFARQFLSDEGIPLVFEDLEGTHARRIDFQPATGRVRARSVAPDRQAEIPTPVEPRQKPQGSGQAGLGSVELF